ncbi:MAG: glycosyltransferase family 4 protein [Candidatus Helarchaeota archaeon]
MKICLIATKFYPDHVGGKAVYTFNYYNELRKNGHDVYVLTGLWNKKINDSHIIQFPIIRRRYLWLISFFFLCLKYLLFNSYDIIHAVGVREGIITYFLFKKFIATVHDAGSFQVNKNIVQKFYPRIISRAQVIIVPSNSTKIVLKKYMPFINEKKIISVLNGVDLVKFNPSNRKKAIQLKNKLDIKGRVILYMGIIKTYKGVEDIIAAYYIIKKKFQDVKLIVAGGPSERMTIKYNMWKNKFPDVIFTGRVPDKLVPMFYAMADIFVTYSWTGEGFGLTSVEAMASGTPVICSDLEVYREVLKDKAILVPPKNPQLLARVFEDLLSNEYKLESLATNGRKFVENNYSWKKTIEKLVRVYYLLKIRK